MSRLPQNQLVNPFALGEADALTDILVCGVPQFDDGVAPVGVVIHAFYPDILAQILESLAKLRERIFLYVTCIAGAEEEIRGMLEETGRGFSLFRVENLGRDVLPFLQLIPHLQKDGIEVILKLHTKKSAHLPGIGTQWAQDLFADLLDPTRFRQSVGRLSSSTGVPIIGSAGFITNVQKSTSQETWEHLVALLKRSEISEQQMLETNFFAGTMFFARTQAFLPLQSLGLSRADFGVEKGQLDGTLAHALERFFGTLVFKGQQTTTQTPYQEWLSSRQLATAERDLLPARLATWPSQPSVLIVLTDTQGDTARVQRSLESLEQQLYSPAAIVVLSDASSDGITGAANLVWLPRGDHWVGQLNELLAQIDVDWFYLLRAGDELDCHALLLLADRVVQQPELGCVFSDEDSLVDGVTQDPVFKPDLNIDLLRGYPYIGRALAFQRSAFLAADGFDSRFAELAPHDLAFKLIEGRGLLAVGHIAEVLVHQELALGQWLVEPEVIAHSSPLVAAHLQRLGIEHQLLPGPLPMINRVLYHHAEQPLVSIVVPTKDQLPMLRRCVESLIEKTRYARYELLIVDNASETPEARNWLAGMERLASDKVRILRYPHPFNYSAINNFAVTQARGDYLVLLNNDTAIVDENWLDALLNHALRPEVGIVGAKLFYPNGGIQHGGVLLGLRGVADHPFIGEPGDSTGYLHRLQVDQNYSAVTAACLMIRKSLYLDMGGMDEANLKVSYNDVDLCLKVGRAGYLITWTPYCAVVHEGNVSQNLVDKTVAEAKLARFRGEQSVMYRRWLPTLLNDPAYNKNLSLAGGGFIQDYASIGGWQPFAERQLPYVLCYAADPYGCGHYRVIQPFASMEKAGLIEGAVTHWPLSVIDQNRLAPQSVIFQRHVLEGQLDVISQTKGLSSALRIYELDDYILELPLKNMHRGFMPKDVGKMLRKGVGLCDRFVVTTAVLAEAFSDLSPDIRVIRNHLPVHWWKNLQGKRRQGRKPRVGWAGGAGHTGDLEMIADVVRDLAGEVEWVFMGICPPALRPYVHEFDEGSSIEHYPYKLANLNLDLALAPLEDNFFNDCKSNLRLLEYGACGFPVVCSDNICYREGNLPVTRVKNRYRDWINAIRMHLADLDATARAGDELRAVIHRDWMLEGEHLKAWSRVWLPD